MTGPRTKSRARTNTPHEPENRPTRVPVSGRRDVLKAYGITEADEKKYHYHFVTDAAGQVERFQAGGYEIVQDPNVTIGDSAKRTGDRIETVANRSRGEMGVLMRIPMEYYLEDRKANSDYLDDLEKTMYRPDEDEGQYGETKAKADFDRG